MIKYLFVSLLFAFYSCSEVHKSELELVFDSNNTDTFQVLQEFSLTSIDSAEFRKAEVEHKLIKTFSFHNIKCLEMNKFIFEGLDSGAYYGMITLEKNGVIYNIPLDSIFIKPGKIIVSKKLNFGPGTYKL